ncbi:MAG: M12 family metallo-peptidase, partial [Phycisphaerales bacterium]|nr:M12 family metallo-peptidase [Phycisphaerales bacterium]
MIKTGLAVIASTLLASATGSMAAVESHAIDSFIKTRPGMSSDLPGVRTLQFDSKLAKEVKRVAARDGRVKLSSIPMPQGDNLELDLVTANPFVDGFRFEMAPGLNSPDTKSTFLDPNSSDLIFLKGTVTGQPDSIVVIATQGTQVEGMIKMRDRTAIITSDRDDPDRPVVVYDPEALPEGMLQWGDWNCETHQADIMRQLPEMPGGGVAGGNGTCYKLKLAIELDYDLISGPLNSNGWAALLYVGTLVVTTDELYRRDVGMGVVMSYGRGWYEADDPWDQSSTFSQLSQFRDYWNTNMVGTDRDVASLLTSRDIGGGRAWDIGTLCDLDDSYNVCGGMDTLFPYPAEDNHPDNWDIVVFAHELGHNLGASHTHAYNPPLDDCFSGGCTSAPNGTLMSYCHFCDGGLANFLLRVHPTNSTVIQQNLAAGACIETGTPYMTAVDDTASTYVNTAKHVDIIANDDGSCDQARVLNFDGLSAQGGTVILLLDAGPQQRDILRYIPPTGFTGTDTFNYVATTSFGDTDGAQVTMTVEAQPTVASEYLVYDQYDRSVRRIDATDYQLLGYFLPAYNNDLVRPRSIAVLPDGDVLIGDDFHDQVLRFNGANGAFEGVFFEDPDLLSCEAIVVFDNRVYMLDYFGGWIFSCDLDGNNGANPFQGSGTGRDMAISSNGDLFVSGSVNGNEITVINRLSGAIEHSIADVFDIETPGGLAFANGNLQVGDASSGISVRIDPWGNGQTSSWTLNS